MTAHYCEDCAEARRATPAKYRVLWGLGSKWLCEACAREYASRWTEARA